MRTIYKLHPGDTIYLVTPEGEIKTIALNKKHFELVDKIKPAFRYAYQYKHGMLYQIESKYNWKYHYKPDDTYIFLVTNELSAEKTEVPLFRVYDTSNNAYSSAAMNQLLLNLTMAKHSNKISLRLMYLNKLMKSLNQSKILLRKLLATNKKIKFIHMKKLKS